MDYFPTFISVKGQKILVIGGGGDAVHKTRLALKSSAEIHVFGALSCDEMQSWKQEGRIIHHDRPIRPEDCANAVLAFIGVDDDESRDHAQSVLEQAGIIYSVIDDQVRSQFITPALVDRDPVIVAIGTEGTSPVLARDIKAKIEAMLVPETGLISKVAGSFRDNMSALPKGFHRRRFWQRYLAEIVPNILSAKSDHIERDLQSGLDYLLAEETKTSQYKAATNDIPKPTIQLVAIQSENPDLLTRQALRALHDADLVVHEIGMAKSILELTRREATPIEAVSFKDKNMIQTIKDHHHKGEKIIILARQHIDVPLLGLLWQMPIEDVTGYVYPQSAIAAPSIEQPYHALLSHVS